MVIFGLWNALTLKAIWCILKISGSKLQILFEKNTGEFKKANHENWRVETQDISIWSYLELSGAILNYLELSGAIWTYLELSEAI